MAMSSSKVLLSIRLMGFRWSDVVKIRSSTSSVRLCLFCFLLLYCNPHLVDATVYTHNETGRVAAYPSLPALFGEPFLEGRLYEGVLQYLVENPFLCEAIDPKTTSFVNGSFPLSSSSSPPPGSSYPGGARPGAGLDEDEDRPIVMLAARGDCPFHFKAMTAESLGPRVQFLIIYNHNLDGEDVLVPMYSEYGTSRLKLLSVTHRTGTALKRYIADYQNNILLHTQQQQQQQQQEGEATNSTTASTSSSGFFMGPVVSMDSMPPEGVMTAQDLQDVLVSTLGLFFMLVSFSGCFLMCAAAAQHGRRHNGGGQHDNGRRASPLWMLLMGDPDTDADPALGGSRVGGAFGRTLLTTEEVEEFLINRSSSHNSGNSSSTNETNRRNSSLADSARTTNSSLSTRNENSIPQEPTGVSSPPSNNNINNEPQQRSTSSSPPASAGDSPNYTHCAICIDDFDESSSEPILKLPCNHAFHRDCIVPWLTERQSKCPLCKYDVLNYVQEMAAEQQPAPRWRVTTTTTTTTTTGSSRHHNNSGNNNISNANGSSLQSWFSFYTSVSQQQLPPQQVPEGTLSATTTELEMTRTDRPPSSTSSGTTPIAAASALS